MIGLLTSCNADLLQTSSVSAQHQLFQVTATQLQATVGQEDQNSSTTLQKLLVLLELTSRLT